MALLGQSAVWPIVRARQLHSQAQMQYQWRFFIPDSLSSTYDLDLSLLAQDVSFPGIEADRETYHVGQLEFYRIGATRRGGTVTATFIEVEGGYVDQFFRDWFEQVDPEIDTTTQNGLVFSRARRPLYQFARTALVQLVDKNLVTGAQFRLQKLIPIRMQPYASLSYAGTGPVMMTVEMACDEVRRLA